MTTPGIIFSFDEADLNQFQWNHPITSVKKYPSDRFFNYPILTTSTPPIKIRQRAFSTSARMPPPSQTPPPKRSQSTLPPTSKKPITSTQVFEPIRQNPFALTQEENDDNEPFSPFLLELENGETFSPYDNDSISSENNSEQDFINELPDQDPCFQKDLKDDQKLNAIDIKSSQEMDFLLKPNKSPSREALISSLFLSSFYPQNLTISEPKKQTSVQEVLLIRSY